MPRFSDGPAHLRVLALLILALLLLARIPFSALHTDLAHDLFVAWQLDRGEVFPWSGRPLAGTIHLGPAYYWLLGALAFVGRGWLGAVVLLGMIAATQIPLAYLLGKEIHSRRAGLIWAAMLLLPSWTSLEWVFPGHNLLTPSLTLAYLLCALRWTRRPRLRYLCGMALFLVLGLHAHPTVVALTWIGIAVVVRAASRNQLPIRHAVLAACVGLLPLLPYFVWDGLNGFADARAGAAYLGDDGKVGHLSSAAAILWATLWGGSRYWLDVLMDWPSAITWLTGRAAAVLATASLFGLAKVASTPSSRPVIAAGLFTALTVLVTTALIRGFTPYYMTTVLRVVLLGVLSVGLAGLGESLQATALRTTAILGSVLLALAATLASASYAARGNWPFSFYPMFDVTGASQPATPTMFLPAYAAARSGRFLCEQPAPSVHGALARQLLYDYGMDMRFACDRSDAVIGGADPARSHWLGLSRAMTEALHVHPAKRFGPLAVVPATPLTENATPLQATPIYPPYDPPVTNKPATREIKVRMQPGQYLVVSNLAYLTPDAEIRVQRNGTPVPAIATDAVSRIYACDFPTESETTVSVTSADFTDIDIVLM